MISAIYINQCSNDAKFPTGLARVDKDLTPRFHSGQFCSKDIIDPPTLITQLLDTRHTRQPQSETQEKGHANPQQMPIPVLASGQFGHQTASCENFAQN
jgi:hypothetical protein